MRFLFALFNDYNVMIYSENMAKQPITRGDVLSKDALREVRRRLALLSVQHVQDFYRRALDDCHLQSGRPPSPRVIQEFVQAWRLLWRWRR
jgi:hypothetical protein